MVMNAVRKAVERLRGRFDFGASVAQEKKAKRAEKTRRPSKRKRHR